MNRRIAISISIIGLNLMACCCGGVGPQQAGPGARPQARPQEADPGGAPEANPEQPNPEDGLGKEARVVLGGDATISINVVVLPGRRVRVVGTTNLPENTNFLVTVEDTVPGFIGQTKCRVRADGRFETESFGAKTGLPDGVYTAQVVMPWTLLQPAQVQNITGVKGEHLTGPLVAKRDGQFGVTLTATKEFSVGGPKAAQETQERVKKRFEAYQKCYESMIELETRLQDARKRQLRRDEKKWGLFAQKFGPDLKSVHDEISKVAKVAPLLSGYAKVGAPLSDLDTMFLATAFEEENKYQAAEKRYRASIAELKVFLAGPQSDGEDK